MTTYDLAEFCDRYDLKGYAEFRKVTEALPPCSPDGPWLCGGALRRLLRGDKLDSDWDYFFRGQEQATAFRSALESREFKRIGGTDSAATFAGKAGENKVKVQAIHLAYYPTIAACLDSFDFTICQFGWDGERMHAAPFALWDLARNRISVNRITYATASVRRLLKYQKQGFVVCEGAIRKLLESVAAQPETIHSEVQYVD